MTNQRRTQTTRRLKQRLLPPTKPLLLLRKLKAALRRFLCVSPSTTMSTVNTVSESTGDEASTTGSSVVSVKKNKNKSGLNDEERRLKEVESHVLEAYRIVKRVGKGAYGIVWEAQEKRDGRRRVALKKIFDAFRNGTDAQRTFREVTFLRALEPHPLIVRLLKIHPSNNGLDLYLVFPFVLTDLHKVIKSKPELLDGNDTLRRIVYEILVATNYLHSAQIIHRDLKPANILLDERLHVQLADFGLARTLTEESADSMEFPNAEMTDYVATRWYRPPEILLSAKTYTKGVDMWSIGCILGEMILKEPLFPGDNTNDQIELILQTILPPSKDEVEEFCRGTKGSVSGAIIEACLEGKKGDSLEVLFSEHDLATVDLLERLLIFSPGNRLSAPQALAHPFFTLVRDVSLEFLCHKRIQPFFDDNARLNLEEYRRVLFDPERFFPSEVVEEVEKTEEEDVDKYYREEEKLWRERRRWGPPPQEDTNLNSSTPGDSMSSALERAETAVQQTLINNASRKVESRSKSILTLPRPIPPPPALCLPSDNLLRGGKPPTHLLLDSPVLQTNLNNNNNTSLVAKSSSIGSLDNISKCSGDSSQQQQQRGTSPGIDEGGDRGILEKFHDLCLKYNFDLPLEEGQGLAKDLLLEKKKPVGPPPPSGEGDGDFMRWPVLPNPLGPSKTSSSSYTTYTSSGSLSSNKKYNPYKPAGLKTGLLSGGGGDAGATLEKVIDAHESRLLEVFPSKAAAKERFQQIEAKVGLERRAKLSSSATGGVLPPLVVSRSIPSTSSSAGSLRHKPPVGPSRTSTGKPNLVMSGQKSGQQQQEQPFRRSYGGITYSKKFTGPSFRRKGLGTQEDSQELWKSGGTHSAYFPNAGVAHPLASSGTSKLGRRQTAGAPQETPGGGGSLEHMVVGPPASAVVRASDLFELKNNIHRHHDPHRHRRQLR